MSSAPAFYFDSSTCSGCKACAVACKDKHSLPVGVLWRRVIEVEGGSWKRAGHAWTSDVFAYYLSVSCNHCDAPVCAEVCPAEAIAKRSDGVVVADQSRCLGCRYCMWACPFGAPQYDPGARVMTKCDLCIDDIQQGVLPACVTACPLRSLKVSSGEVETQGGYVVGVGSVFPFVGFDYTKPGMLVKKHGADAPRSLPIERARPQVASRFAKQEAPLVVFTLASQAAIGGTWVLIVLAFAGGLYLPLLAFSVPVLMAIAGLASAFHLGQPQRAWRAVSNVRSSWLSREILATVVFGVTGVISLTTIILRTFAYAPVALLIQLSASMALLFAMARAYGLRTQPGWNRSRTFWSFASSSLLLGLAVFLISQALWASPLSESETARYSLLLTAAAFGIHQLITSTYFTGPRDRKILTIRTSLVILCLAAAFLYFFLVNASVLNSLPIAVMIPILAVVSFDRVLFYTLRVQPPS